MMEYGKMEAAIAEINEKQTTVKDDIQETHSCLCEMSYVLNEFFAIVFGNKETEKDIPRDASSLSEEARMMTALAHDNLQKLNKIKNGII